MARRGWAPSRRVASASDAAGTGLATPHPTVPLHVERPEPRMIHRECGVLKTTYAADMALYPLPIARWTVGIIALLMFAVVPFTLHEYYLSIVNLASIAVIGALGLNILVGYSGQISVGHGAFMSLGAYTAANFAVRLGWPFLAALPMGGLMAAAGGAARRFPSLTVNRVYPPHAT